MCLCDWNVNHVQASPKGCGAASNLVACLFQDFLKAFSKSVQTQLGQHDEELFYKQTNVGSKFRFASQPLKQYLLSAFQLFVDMVDWLLSLHTRKKIKCVCVFV